MMQLHILPLAPIMAKASAALDRVSLGGGVLEPQGPVGAGNAQILLNAVAIMLMIVVPTILTTFAFAWWFRASNKKATYRPNWTYSGRIELIVWGIPLLVVLFLSGVIWIGSRDQDPARPLAGEAKPFEIQVVSLDWKWLFIYPEEGVASVNEIAMPAGRPAHFSLTSGTVMNMFYVPQLGSMIATMNGMVTELHLKADHPGDYYGQSAQFSGDGFSDMHFLLRALPPESFAQWTADARKSGAALDENAYLALARERAASPTRLYGSIDRTLFENVAARRITSEAEPPSRQAQKME
ncbi:MAG TPA: ubiquinol oxidase subunit II [Methylocystis sp.]|nr:ubiquinol oxidase subunit II [Methylocystis sp.]